MAYYDEKEHAARSTRFAHLLGSLNLDFAIVYYDETSIANGWYLTGWCPQFECGSVLVTRTGKGLILGGPESEPFARQDSAIKDTRNLPIFMVPDEEYPNANIIDFGILFREISVEAPVKRVGIVGMDKIPTGVYRQLVDCFTGVEIVDITQPFIEQRFIKTAWEREQMQSAFSVSDECYRAMKAAVKPGAFEYEVAAAGEYAARSRGASGYGFKTIVGSGPRADAVVPTSHDRRMQPGELVMVGMAPQIKGYCGCVGDTLPVSGAYSHKQLEMIKQMREVFMATREMLRPGVVGREVHAPGKKLFEKYGYLKYLICPFAHTIGINEAESPFFGPNSDDVIKPDMTICVDVSFFGHPEFHGVRIETGFYITEKGSVPFSPFMDVMLSDIR